MGLLKKYPALFMGIGITILFLMICFVRIDFLEILELKLYDIRMKLKADQTVSDKVVLVNIDDSSIEKIGHWPWKRSFLADGIKKINSGSPRVIGLNIILSEPEDRDSIKKLESLYELFNQIIADQQGEKFQSFNNALKNVIISIDNDKNLAMAIKQVNNVAMPSIFKGLGTSQENSQQIDEFLIDNSIPDIKNPNKLEIDSANEILMPISVLLKSSKGTGHSNLTYDIDGNTRREKVFFQYNGLIIPSYTIKLASLYLNIPLEKISAQIGSAIYFNSFEIPINNFSEMLVCFKSSPGTFKNYSWFDVVNDKIPVSVFKNKLVLISVSGAGIMNPLTTPVNSTMPVGEFTGHAVSSILEKQFITQPVWGYTAELVMILIIGIILVFIFPRFKARISGSIFIGVLILLTGGAVWFFVSKSLWIRVTYPVAQLLIGYIGVMSINYFITETSKEKVEGESAETNRMLGVSFQSQGMLDMAFDKFRKVPVDDQMKDLLYNLGLDYERKRQLNKAASVYEYIEEHDSSFKDVSERKKKLMQVSETMIFGDGFLGGSSSNQDLSSTGIDTRPTLGRYEIVKQLGKGAMGVVYLGKDPRINRTTAIKTIRFTDDFEEDLANKLKEKFFREAESAGTLSHPNIVTIYDAGDEQDLAYIAMEYLEGEDLEKYTKKDNLLPMRTVIDYIADIGDALDYAHQKGIVHRDIKPANIMRLKNGVVKITDFGIARITATSQTQTGIVKGTPYYMSPEQIAGKKVDGRSDIFSMGVMLFQFLTGEVPFKGDSPAALMHQILNMPHPDPRTINKKIFKPFSLIIGKALEKEPDKRYPRANQMSSHLRQLGKKIDLASAKK